ncbi:MAG TPA: transporter substrate-binding domain-containing protein [Albitalea sp.]
MRRVLAGIALCAGLQLGLAQPAGTPHFRSHADSAVPALGAQLLTPEERAYLARLPTVRVAVPTPPAEPYELIGADGEISGIHPEMLLALGQAFGIRMTPVVLTGWPAVLEAARRREVDIVMTVGVTAERSQYLEFTLGATPWPGALFTRKGAPPADLPSARFALERDYLANDFVRRQYPQATILAMPTTGDALRAVADGRADVYLGSLLETSAWLAREPVPGVEAARLLDYGSGSYHFGVRKDWAPLAAILNKGIQTLRSGPNTPLDAALSGLPAPLRPAPTLALDAREAAVLVRHPVWRIGAVRGLALLNDVDERGVHSGIAAEYVEQVARRLGVGTVIVPFDNVASMLEALRAGRIDAVPFLTRTPKRAAEFAYSTPYVEMPYMLVARSDGPLYWSLASLDAQRLALAHEHPLREVIAQRHPQVRIVDAPNGNVAMDMVARGDADAAVEVKLFANLRIHGDNDGTLRTTTTIDELPAQFSFAASTRAAELVPLIDRALADIAPAEHQRMLRRWVAIDLKPAFAWRRYLPALSVAGAALLVLLLATGWWMRRLRREATVRRRSEELLNDIATSVPGLAFRYVVNAAGTLRQHYFTPGARAFLGRELETRRSLIETLAPHLRADQRDAALALERGCLRSGARLKLTLAYTPPEGPERWLHAEAVRSRASEEGAVWTGYVVDVSAEHELQAQVMREAEARNLLLATASHELRVPTNNLSLALQAIRLDELGARNADSVRIAKRSADTLGQLLNDVLDAAKFDSGTMRLCPRTFDLREMLQELDDVWRMAAKERGLGFVMVVEHGVPPVATLDPLRLRQILTNLLSNACKFTAEGQVGLQVSRDARGLNFVVSDTGVGMSPEAQQRLFQPFVTIDSGVVSSSTLPSTGLGMLVSRKLAELMGGSIAVHSEAGVGTSVTLHVPLPADRPVTGLPAQGQIVVCDDDPTCRLLMVHMLRGEGFDVGEAGDAQSALALFDRAPVMALVTDMNLPGMSGAELIRAVRAGDMQRGMRTAVIVCSGSAAPGAPPPDASVSHDAYLLKPVQIETLAHTLRQLGVRAAPASRGADAQLADRPMA